MENSSFHGMGVRMIRRWLFTLTACLLTALTLLSLPAAAEDEPADYARIGREIGALYSKHENTAAGLVTAVFGTEEVGFTGCYGYADKENGIPMDESTVVDWGSATKLTVWVSAMQLYEQGRLDLDADVRDYLPEGFLRRLRYDEPITMRHLMNHTAGFEDILIGRLETDDPGNALSLGDCLRERQPAQVFHPGEHVAYSNYGAALAGYVIECITGEPFDQYVHEHIFGPLGMTHSALRTDLSDVPGMDAQRDVLQGYTRYGQLIPDSRIYVCAYPAGMCTSTIGDFAVFGQALLRRDERLMRAETFAEFFSPSLYYEGTDRPRACHGLLVSEAEHHILGHGGNTDSCTSGLYFDPEAGVGVVIMTNQQSEDVFTTGIPALVFGTYEGEPLQDFTYAGTFEIARRIWRGPFRLPCDLRLEVISPQLIQAMDGEVIHQAGDTIEMSGTDLLLISPIAAGARRAMLLVWIAGMFISALHLLIGFIRFLAGRPAEDPLHGWRTTVCLAQVVVCPLYLAILSDADARGVNTLCCLMIGAAGLVLAGGIAYGIMRLREKEEGTIGWLRRRQAGLLLVCSFAAVCTIVTEELFMFWEI